MSRKKRSLKILWILIAVLALLFAGGTLWVSDYYHADETAVALLTEEIPGMTVTVERGRIIFMPGTVRAGLIFYPGGKVEYTSYAPLMKAFADQGFLCVLMDMPLKLAFLNRNAADAVFDDFPEVTQWYVGGHSLGGSMAASYAGAHPERLNGLILLGAYSTVNLKKSGLSVLSVYGSEDGVLNRKRYDAGRENLPPDTLELEIAGGCHAYFGNYGPQKGDGIPSISREEQQFLTAELAGRLIQ